MSTNSLSVDDRQDLLEGGGAADLGSMSQQFDCYDSEHFHVEYTEKGADLVYHFWPQGRNNKFLDGFSQSLEDAFVHVLPSTAEVLAAYTNLQEATVQHMHGSGAVPKRDFDKELVIPRATYYVRVVGGLKNPLADIFLKKRVFKRLEEELKEHV